MSSHVRDGPDAKSSSSTRYLCNGFYGHLRFIIILLNSDTILQSTANKLCGKPRNIPRPCTPHAAAQLQPIYALRLRHPARLVP